jgi:hypothetical protein
MEQVEAHMCGNTSAPDSPLHTVSVESVFEAVTADARNQSPDLDVDEVCGVTKVDHGCVIASLRILYSNGIFDVCLSQVVLVARIGLVNVTELLVRGGTTPKSC